MKRAVFAITTGILTISVLAPTASASSASATPVPGRFCKVADIGKKVQTAKYGIVICKKDGSRARWK